MPGRFRKKEKKIERKKRLRKVKEEEKKEL